MPKHMFFLLYQCIRPKKWLKERRNLLQKRISLEILNAAEQEGVKYFNVLFHDIYYSNGYTSEREWFVWLVKYLNEKSYKFVTFKEAVKELNSEACWSSK